MIWLMAVAFIVCMLIGVPMAYSAGSAAVVYVLTSASP